VALADLVSPTSAFVRDRCQVEPASEVPCDELYNAWKAWAEDNGHRAGSSSSFGRDLRAVLPGLRTVRPREDDRKRWYRGLRLHPSHNSPEAGPSWTRPSSQPVESRSDPAVQDGPAGQPLWSGGVESLANGAARRLSLPAPESAPQYEPAELRDWLAAPVREPDDRGSDEWETIG